jgi:hypothetical protein
LAYWTINNKEEIWVYYQGSVKWYNKYYNDAVKIINSIKLKNKPVNNIITLNPGSASGEDVCDSDCAEKILSNCSQGNFSIIRNSDLGVTKLNFKILNQQGSSSGMCKTGVSISQSSKPDLVGPSMECILKPKIKSLYDLQNFVTDKFAPLNSNNYSSCSGSLYDMVKDLIL